MRNTFRILAASDVHGDTKQFTKLAEKAEQENVDLVVLAGDILGFSETKGILKPFTDRNKRVLIIPGNWDSFATTDFMANLYGVRNIHGYSAVYKNIGFFGAGGADGPGPGRTSDKEILETLRKAHKDLEGIERKIMVTHEHPSQSKSEFSGIPGSKAIRQAIDEFHPDVLLHGHIHEAAGFLEDINGTRIINVGREGAIIEL